MSLRVSLISNLIPGQSKSPERSSAVGHGQWRHGIVRQPFCAPTLIKSPLPGMCTIWRLHSIKYISHLGPFSGPLLFTVKVISSKAYLSILHMEYLGSQTLPNGDPTRIRAQTTTLYWRAHNRERAFWRSMIISFSSPSTLNSDNHLNAGAKVCDDVVYMYDDDDFEGENVKITSPGESITSARAFMR